MDPGLGEGAADGEVALHRHHQHAAGLDRSDSFYLHALHLYTLPVRAVCVRGRRTGSTLGRTVSLYCWDREGRPYSIRIPSRVSKSNTCRTW